MKKMIAMLLVGGVLAVCTVGCGPASSTENKTSVTADKTKVETKDKPKEITVDKDKVKVEPKEKDAK